MANMKLTLFGHNITSNCSKPLKDLRVGDWFWFAAGDNIFQHNRITRIECDSDRVHLFFQRKSSEDSWVFCAEGTNFLINYRDDYTQYNSMSDWIITTDDNVITDWISNRHPKLYTNLETNG